MQLVTIPPGGRAFAHRHLAHETAIYALSGTSAVWHGADLEHHAIVRPGSCFSIPANTPHLPYNPSATEPVVAVIARTDPNEQESVDLMPELDGVRPPSDDRLADEAAGEGAARRRPGLPRIRGGENDGSCLTGEPPWLLRVYRDRSLVGQDPPPRRLASCTRETKLQNWRGTLRSLRLPELGEGPPNSASAYFRFGASKASKETFETVRRAASPSLAVATAD